MAARALVTNHDTLFVTPHQYHSLYDNIIIMWLLGDKTQLHKISFGLRVVSRDVQDRLFREALTNGGGV